MRFSSITHFTVRVCAGDNSIVLLALSIRVVITDTQFIYSSN